MIEQLPPPSGVSLFEAVLARWLVELVGASVLRRAELRTGSALASRRADARRRTRGADTDPAGTRRARAAGGDPALDRPMTGFRGWPGSAGLLEAGAGHLAAARAAHREQCRQAARAGAGAGGVRRAPARRRCWTAPTRRWVRRRRRRGRPARRR